MSRRRTGKRTLSLATAFAAITALVGLLAVPSALGISAPSANGKDYFVKNSHSVYQLGPKGDFHLIPDVPTANAMGLNWDTLHIVASVSPIGAQLPSILPAPASGATSIVKPTVKANGADYVLPDGRVFQRDVHGVYHWIPNTLTANAMGIKWDGLHVVKSVSPVGRAIPSVIEQATPVCKKRISPTTKANGMDFIVPPNPNVYQRDSRGVYHLIPDKQTANAMGVNWTRLHKVHSVAPIGNPIHSVCVG